MTLTQNLAGKMASIRREINDTMKYMTDQTKEIDAWHDAAAAEIKTLDEQIAEDPGNEEAAKKRDEYDRVSSGLYAASEYGTGLVEQFRAAA